MGRERRSKRAKKDYTLRQKSEGAVWTARFRAGGRTVERSTGTSDEEAAHVEAPPIIAAERAKAGRVPVRRSAVSQSRGNYSLQDLVVAWLLDPEVQLRASTRKTWGEYARFHWYDFFGGTHHLNDLKGAEYVRFRLGKVRATTVRKECSALRGFLRWCVEQKVLATEPLVPSVPKRARGVAYAKRRRTKASESSPEEVWQVIMALDECSASRKVARFVIRDRFIFGYLSGLRPSSLDRLAYPRHYAPGYSELCLTEDTDKIYFDRDVPLDDSMRLVLDRVIAWHRAEWRLSAAPGDAEPKEFLLFGHHDYRVRIAAAAGSALPPHVAATFCAAHLRSACITHALERGISLPALMEWVGHTDLASTTRYNKASLRAARQGRAVDAAYQAAQLAKYGADSPAEGPAKLGIPNSAPVVLQQA